jgi:hypothetical protein
MIGAVNQVSLERANAFLAAVAAKVPVGEVLTVTPAEIGRELGMPDALSTARAVRALIARRRLEPASGSYRLVDARPLEPGEKESIARRPRAPRTSSGRRSRAEGRPTGPTYSDLGRAAVDRLVELGQEASSLRATVRSLKEEARQSRDARIDAEQRADFLATKVRDLEARAEMAESNLRTLLAAARGRGAQRDASLPDSEMEAILGVLKAGDEDRPATAD